MKPRAFVGTSGWQYPGFVERFYPKSVASADQLAYYARRLNAVEVNRSFYNFNRPTTLEKWASQAPDSFRFAMKANKLFTHVHPLQDPEERLGEFFDNLRVLGPKLGPVLFQTPPSLKFDAKLLAGFLKLLPQDLRYTFELRDPSWWRAETYKILRKRNVAFCIADLKGKIAPLERTADFVYVRLHGPSRRPYRDSYSTESLKLWAERLAAWRAEGAETWIFFDNTMMGDAIDNALAIAPLR